MQTGYIRPEQARRLASYIRKGWKTAEHPFSRTHGCVEYLAAGHYSACLAGSALIGRLGDPKSALRAFGARDRDERLSSFFARTLDISRGLACWLVDASGDPISQVLWMLDNEV